MTFAKYQKLIARRPLLANMLQTGFLFGTGDFLAQRLFPDDGHHDKQRYDWERSLRAIVYGGIIFAPLGHNWYIFLSKINVGRSKVANTIARVGVDQLVFAPFIGIPMYYTVMTMFEMKPLASIKEKIRKNWWPTLRNNWLVWPAFQMVNFYLVPLQYRLLVVNLLSIGWNTYLSFVLNQKGHHIVVGDNEQLVLAEDASV